MAAAWRIEGPLDINVLRQSLNEVAARHDILRTRFEAGQRPDEVPISLFSLRAKSHCLSSIYRR